MDDVDPVFASILDWSAFSVRVAEARAQSVLCWVLCEGRCDNLSYTPEAVFAVKRAWQCHFQVPNALVTAIEGCIRLLR